MYPKNIHEIMKKNLEQQQLGSKHSYFAQKLTSCLIANQIQVKPASIAAAINSHYRSTSVKPHTVRKWLLGLTQPRSETLFLIAKWLKVDPKDLISRPLETFNSLNKVNFEFDFTDQEVISKYLAMTIKEKITIRLVIDAISDKNR
jgi:transcriptional regulator with XRE-family HTH domain